jgi:protein-tyrosine phosphatase
VFNRILFVCIGNVCRSPMAEAAFADRMRKRGIPLIVQSAGIGALVGHPADATALAILAERGIDASAHRARQLTPALARDFELILVMDGEQQRAVEAMSPTSRGRVHRIGRRGDFDVPDPYRRDRAAFERAFALIERGLDDLEGAFWPRRDA